MKNFHAKMLTMLQDEIKVYFLYLTGTNHRKCLYEVKMN